MTQMGARPGAFRLIMREGGQIREMAFTHQALKTLVHDPRRLVINLRGQGPQLNCVLQNAFGLNDLPVLLHTEGLR